MTTPSSNSAIDACLPSWNEAARLAALDRYAILDTGREEAFDDVAALAADLFDAPIAVVNLIAADRQWFKAEVGIGSDTLPLDVSICRHAILQPGVLVVPDLIRDKRFDGNPLVHVTDGLRFYAGALLETPEGLPLGTLCVLDTKARPEGITERQERALKVLASQTMARLELRRSEAIAQEERARAEKHARRLSLVAKGSTLLMGASDPGAAVRDLFALIANEFQLDVGFHYRCGDGALRLVAAAGLTPEQERAAARIEFGQTVCGIVAARREAMHLTDIQVSDDEHAAFLKMLGLNTYFSAPLLAGSDLLGTVSLGRTGKPFSAGELEALRTLAAQLAAAIERSHVEDAMRESEARFRALATVGSSAIYRMSPDWREIRLNGAGFVVDTDGPTTDWLDNYVPPDDLPRVREAIERAIRTKDAYELVHRVYRADGTIGWTSARAIPLFDDAGEIVEWFGTGTDVTARVHADQGFTRLFQASPAPFLVLAPDAPRFTIKEVNDAYLAATMTTREGIVGRGVFDAFPDNPDDPTVSGVSILRASLERVLATHEPDALPNFKYDVVRPDGTFEERWWSPVNSPVLDDNGDVEAIIHNANDVTEERRAAAWMRETEERLRLAVDNAEIGFWDVDIVNDALIWPPRTKAMFGISADVPVGMQDFYDGLYPDDRLATSEAFAAAADPAQRALYDVEYRTVGQEDGVIRWVAAKGRGVFNEDGCLRVAGTAIDITLRKRAEQRRLALVELSDAIRRAENPGDLAYAASEILGRTLGVSRVGYGTIDHDAETLHVDRDWNAPDVESLAGVLGLRDFGSYIDDMKRGDVVVIPDVFEDERTVAAAKALESLSGRAFVAVSVVEHGRLRAVIYVNHAEARAWTADDLALIKEVAERTRTAMERLRTEAALRESEATARVDAERVQLALAAGAIIGTWVWDIPTDQFTADEGFARSFGFDPELGRSGVPLDQATANVHPEDKAGLAAAIEKAIEHGPGYTHQYRVKRDNGPYYWVEASGRVDRDADGTPVKFPGVVMNIDARRAVEEERDRVSAELRSLNHDLEKRVVERTSQLTQAEDALRQAQKMEAIGQLTGGVAHDFNNLLTVIRGSVDLLRRNDLPEDRRAKYVDAIADTADRATKLTAQLLAFARRQALKPDVFDARDAVTAIGAMVATLAGSRIIIRNELADFPCFVNVDPTQFDTAIVNFAVNARDAMESEGVLTISVDAVSGVPAVREKAAIEGAYIAVSIADTGTGIDPDQLAQIFEPFFTTKSVGKGTGLGLSQVFGFAHQSGGEVQVESVVALGTTFTLYLPQATAPADTIEQPQPNVMIDGHGLSVLVVEDNEEVGKFAMRALRELGYNTAWASDGKKALALLEQHPAHFDIVFSDVIMPGMNGVDLALEIRETYHDLPVILTSGYSHILAKNGTYGFDLLHKPYSIDQLSQTLLKAAVWHRRKEQMGE